MSRRDAEAPLDPAMAVAGLLTRLGIFALIVLVPMMAIVSRRAVAVFVPLATVLLFIAAALSGRLNEATMRLLRALVSPATLAFIAFVICIAASLTWALRPDAAYDRLSQLVLTLALAVATVAALPERTRPSDANLVPIGVAIATVTLALGYVPSLPLGEVIGRGAPTESQRAAMLLVLLVWPANAALLARGRVWPALVLSATLIATLWLIHDLVVIGAFILGALAFGMALWRPVLAVRVFGAIALLALAMAPGIGWLMAEYGGFLTPASGDNIVAIWRDVTYALPGKLFFGWGFEASAALQRTTSNMPLGSPQNAALQLWLELGLVGVVLALIALFFGLRAIERGTEHMRPAAIAVLTAGGAMMFAGLVSWAIWWFTALGLAAILIAFVGRIRPRLRF